MATIGQQLLTPETGWKRYDDSNSAIKYDGVWGKLTNTSAFGGSVSEVNIGTAKISFSFKGSKIRFITFGQTNRNSTVNIKIDNTTEVFSQKASSAVWQMLAYEKIGLTDSIHSVEIWSDAISSSEVLTIDAIDIDSNGRLLHPHEVLTLGELQVGKRIRCNYIASSGQVGVFSKIGEETYVDGIKDFIPTTSSTTPNGDFYFIMVEDFNGRKKLIADRNIQQSISWDALNTSGIASGSGLPLTSLSEEPTLENGFNRKLYAVRLLTGGINSADTDNEWIKYIVNSSLDGVITPGDNSIWNWSGLWSWTSSTPSASNIARTIRGNGTASQFNYSNTNLLNSFRPLIETSFDEIVSINKSLILHDGEYKKYGEVLTGTTTGDLLPFPFTSYVTNGVKVSASLEIAGYPAYYAFDKNNDTQWITASGTIPSSPQHLTVEFDSPKKVTNIIINEYNARIGDFSLQYSDDGVSYFNALEANLGTHVKGQDKSFAIIGQEKHKYWRLLIRTNNVNSHGVASITLLGEIEKYTSLWQTISSTLPTVNQFIDNGIDSLTPLLDRKVKTLEPQTMDSKIGILPQGGQAKVFSKKLDLNKYMDIRKIEVK